MPFGGRCARGSIASVVRLLALLVCLTFRLSPAHAQSSQTVDATKPTATPQIEPGILPTALAVGPGFVLHGAGAFVAGDRLAARRLLLSEGVSVTTFFATGALLATTGASRKLVAVGLPIVATGVSVFMLGWAADIYAASTGGRDVTGTPELAPIEAELGHRYVYDPQFAYRNFIYARTDLRAERFRISPSAWIGADDDNQRLNLDTAYRVWGRSIGRPSPDGTHLDLAMGLTYHRYPNDGFAVYTPEWRIEGRLDLAHVGPSLRGAFVEAQLGYGLELYDFATVSGGPDPFGLLLARFGFGIYFGDSALRTGEVIGYYDHRHDDFAAGLGVSGIGGGFLGHVGLKAHHYFWPAWGAGLLLEGGSAIVSGLSLKYRWLPKGGAR